MPLTAPPHPTGEADLYPFFWSKHTAGRGKYRAKMFVLTEKIVLLYGVMPLNGCLTPFRHPAQHPFGAVAGRDCRQAYRLLNA